MSREVFALFFSPTSNTKLVTRAIAKGIAEVVAKRDYYSIDFTAKGDRLGVYEFGPDDIVIFGMPTYAGRIPNKIESYVSESVFADGALCIPVVTYGNRAFDDSLKELSTIIYNNGMEIIGGVAVPCEHAFSLKLATGRPNEEDIKKLYEYGKLIGETVRNEKFNCLSLDDIPGRDIKESKYYRPLKEDGEPAAFLKALPVTDENKCIGCNKCKEICPMGCFDESVINASGTCIKCHGCVHACSEKAKHFEDADLSSHIKMLEKNFAKECRDILFITGRGCPPSQL